MRVPLVYLNCCLVPNCLGKQGELSGNCLPNLTVRFILSPSILLDKIRRAENVIDRHPRFCGVVPDARRLWGVEKSGPPNE